MKHIITGLLTALVLAAPAQAQKPQPMKERGARYEVVKEWRKAFGQLKKEVEALKKEVAELKRNQRIRSRVRSRKPSIRSKRGRPDVRKSQGRKGVKKTPHTPKKR
tara:strand:+ start:190 stop:507 length:318 start_codon:yes stop_codon:yes gene_type:complete